MEKLSFEDIVSIQSQTGAEVKTIWDYYIGEERILLRKVIGGVEWNVAEYTDRILSIEIFVSAVRQQFNEIEESLEDD